MIEGENKVLQAFLGTLMTWGLTAAGSALVFVFSAGRCSAEKRKVLDGSLGFAAGVMTAASFWSLLAPAIEKAEESGHYGKDGKFAFGPVAIGFALGGLFVFISDKCIPHLAGKDPTISLAMHHSSHDRKKDTDNDQSFSTQIDVITNSEKPEETLNEQEEEIPQSPYFERDLISDEVELKVRNRKKTNDSSQVVLQYEISTGKDKKTKRTQQFESWKRILLLIIAITVHNIPEGLAVGVSFGAIGSSKEATFQSARNLAIGIGIQNFPEGMAVSIPLCAAGYSPLKSFWYGQLSGMVEPVFGVLGALIVIVADPLLPYALAFAAGAMIYVVVDDIIPEANMCGNGRIASWGCMLGFIIMMCLDVGLG